MIICLFILAIAWTNYINLTTARSMKRAKEVGIKKIVGAGKKQLIEQFLLESTIINLVAILLAITLVQVLLPYFEKLVGEDLQVNLVNSDFLIIIPGFLVLGVVVSGLYPALLLSSFKSISMLTGVKIRWSNKAGLRKALVVVQYMITFSLILGTFTVYKQLSHMRNSALGFNMQQMLIVRAPKFNNSDIGAAKFNVFKNNLRSQKRITGVTASNDIPGGKNLGGALRFTSILNNEEIITFFPVVSVDPDFFETYEIKL
ncbi:MAG: FtsX-like permease family protein [Cyclobacteriaceae bacterium]|nr:FtsX-like permease family protein [Cyclobacteriaceae bacterium]